MFDIGWTELLVVAVIAIIVVGPKDLPGMLRTVGQTIGRLRRMATEFQGTFNDALKEAERQAGVDEMRKEVESVGNFDPLSDLKKSIEIDKDPSAKKIAKDTQTDGAELADTSSAEPKSVPKKPETGSIATSEPAAAPAPSKSTKSAPTPAPSKSATAPASSKPKRTRTAAAKKPATAQKKPAARKTPAAKKKAVAGDGEA
ncbi:MAG: Sec-independent protein translocase protein TatB [Stappiaceae bacterium]